VSYPKLIHVTYAAHALHRIYDIIRVLYPNANKLVANGKKIVVKVPATIELFKSKAPDATFPFSTSRWETWWDVIVYYAKRSEVFCSVANELDRDDASSIVIL
jgi:hypothetical protein